MYLLTYHQQKHYKDRQTKVNQEAVSSEVSKFNHAVINKKQGDQMQFSIKKKMGSSNPLYQSVDCVIKWGNRFINSIRISFICLMKCLSCNREKIAEMS